MADSVQEYQEFASDFTGSVASLQQETCLDFVPEEIPTPVVCYSCTPDPNASVPDWTTTTKPFLNKQTCQYYVTIVTSYTDVGGDDLVNRYKLYAPVAARKLLRFYNKLETDLIVDTLVNGYAGSGPVIQGKDWFIPFNNNSRLILLYVIDAFNFDGLASDEEDPNAFGEEPIPSSNEVTLELSSLPIKLDRLTRIFSVYSRLQAALRNVDNGSIMFENAPKKEFIIGDVENQTSLLYEISSIESVINKILVDFSFAEIGAFGAISSYLSNVFAAKAIRNANYIKFGFTDEYVLDNITIIETGCPDVVIKGNKLTDRYSNESPLNNPTVIAYLSRLDDLYDATMAQDAPEWTDIILEFTYPSVTINYGANTLFDDEESLAQCIAEAISDYGQNVSNKLLNLIYSYPDLVADRLNKYLCTDVNLSEELTAADILAQEKANFLNKLGEALAESELLKTVTAILELQLRIATLKIENGGKISIGKIFEDIWDDYGFCGFLALLQGLLACIAYNFSFEELLKKIVEAGLKNISPLQMTRFIAFLPADKQAEVILKVDQVLQENDIVSQLFQSFNTDGTLAEMQTSAEFEQEKAQADALDEELQNNIKLAKTSLEQAEALTQLIAAEENAINTEQQTATGAQLESLAETEDAFETAQVQSSLQEWSSTNVLEAARVSSVNSRKAVGSTAFGDTIGQIQTIVMQAYIDALLELVDINDLYAALVKIPGVKIIAQLINAANCPTPDDNAKVTWLNFLHTLEIEWCRFQFDITLPPWPTFPDITAFISALWRALGQVAKEIFLRFIAQIFYEILLKILEMLINGLCKLLGTIGEAAAAALTGGNPTTAFLDLFRETFGCDPVESSEQEEALLEAIAQIFGGQSGSSVTTQEAASFMQNASSALTSYELVDLLKGRLSADKARYLKEFLRLTDPRLSSLFPNESSLTSLFSTLGNLIPNNILQEYEDRATAAIDSVFPANTSVCGTPDSIDKFRKLREDILSGKGLSDDEIKHQIDGMQDRADENLKFLVDLATKGVGNMAGEKVMTSLGGPDALTNPNSVFSTPACSSSIYDSAFSTSTTDSVSSTTNDIFFNCLVSSYLNDLFKEPSIFDAFSNAPVAFLNGVLADKNGRDFVKHNKQTNDIFGRVYNSETQQNDYETAFNTNADGPTTDGYFPDTVAKLTQTELKKIAESSDSVFSIQTSSYDSASGRRYIFGKNEDFSLIIDTANGDSQQSTNQFIMLYSQNVLSGAVPSDNNLTRLAIMQNANEGDIALNLRSGFTNGEEPETETLTISGNPLETVRVMYQSKFDLDEATETVKDQYMPVTLTYSPQADSFLSYIQQKIDLGEYSSTPTVNVDVFNNISDKAMKWVISTLTDDEAYKYGYEYEKEKITIEDLELDPETLERKTNNPRIQFLDYTKYGGTEDQPPIYIKPATRTGWLGVADSIIPELSCEPQVEKLVDFESLKSLLSDLQSSLSDDPALQYSPDCREVVPYLKPLSAEMAAKLQVVIVAVMRIHIGEAILRCIPLYNKFVVSYDKIIDELYIDYIQRKIEDNLLNQETGILGLGLVNDEYYLRFLEQCVQIVGRKKQAGEIELTSTEQNALDSINKMIRDFYFVKEKDTTFLEQLNGILVDLKDSTLKLQGHVKNETTSDVQEKYDSFIEILNTRVTEYPELSTYLDSIPQLYDTYYNSADENAIATNSSINNLSKQLKALLMAIGKIQNQTATNMDDMLSDVMSKLNEQFFPVTISQIRREMVFEGIRRTKYEAKILMRKILKDELNSMASSFATNVYTGPEITNIRKYFLDADDKLILRNISSSYFDVAAIPASGNNPLSAYSDIVVGTGSVSISGSVDYIDNPNGYFILERYIKLQDRELPLSGTTIPAEITNRPDHINGVINVYAFKDWISTLSDSTKNTEMFKLFGDLSVSGTVETGYQLTGSTLGVKYGLRLSYVPSATTFTSFGTSNASINESKAYSLSSVRTLDGRQLKNSSYIIPVGNAEIDLVDDLLGNFDPDNGLNLYNHDCLVKELYESSEFRFLFYYCFPLQKYMSANSVFITESYVETIGYSDGWVSSQQAKFTDPELSFKKSKTACSTLFDIYYNWEDTQYQNSSIKSFLNGPDNLLQSISSFLRPVAAGPWFPFLRPFLSKIVPRRPYDEDGNDCDVIDR